MLGAVLAVPAWLLPVWGLSIAARTGAASSLTIPISTIAVVVLGVPAVAATGPLGRHQARVDDPHAQGTMTAARPRASHRLRPDDTQEATRLLR